MKDSRWLGLVVHEPGAPVVAVDARRGPCRAGEAESEKRRAKRRSRQRSRRRAKRNELLKERGWLVLADDVGQWGMPASTSPSTASGCGQSLRPIRKGRGGSPAPDDAVCRQQLGVYAPPPVTKGGTQEEVQSRAAAGRGANGRPPWGWMRQVDRHQSFRAVLVVLPQGIKEAQH